MGRVSTCQKNCNTIDLRGAQVNECNNISMLVKGAHMLTTLHPLTQMVKFWARYFPENLEKASVTPLHGPLARYVKLRVAHAPGMPGTFSPPSRVSDPDMHHSTCATHVPLCMPGSLNSVFLWSRWRGKRSRHSWRMRNPKFYVSGNRPINKRTCPMINFTTTDPFHYCLFFLSNERLMYKSLLILISAHNLFYQMLIGGVFMRSLLFSSLLSSASST